MSKHTPEKSLPRKLLDVACRMRVRETLFRDDELVDEAAHELVQLRAATTELLSALNAMLTHMGMDEDEWNKPTFDKARAAIAKATGEQA